MNIKHFCQYCPLNFKRDYSLKKHILKAHPEEKFAEIPNFVNCEMIKPRPKMKSKLCPICRKAFSTKKNLKRHLDYVHGQQGEGYACDLCDKRLFSMQGQIDHKNAIHLKIKNHQCSKCNRKYFWKLSLQRHEAKCDGKGFPQCKYTNFCYVN